VKRRRIALEFREEQPYREALALLDEVEGDWALPRLMTIIIDASDLHVFDEAGLPFEKLPVIAASRLTAEERARLRRPSRGV
jgi:hypothetical protein